MESIEDLLKELNERLRKGANIQRIKEHIALEDKYDMQTKPACRDYKNLVKCHAHEYSESAWSAIYAAREDDIIIDTNGAFNNTYRYLIFDDRDKYQRYIGTYMEDRDCRYIFDRSLYEDQFRIIPSTQKQKLAFNTTEVSNQELGSIIEVVVRCFNIKHEDILVIGKSLAGIYEIVLLTIENTLAENALTMTSFLNRVGDLYPGLKSKIQAKPIFSDEKLNNGTTYIKLLQTQKMRNGRLQEIAAPIINLTVNNNSHNSNTINGNRNSLAAAGAGNAAVNNVVADTIEKKLEKYIQEHPPGLLQGARAYYEQVQEGIGQITETTIRKELIKQKYIISRTNKCSTWRKTE